MESAFVFTSRSSGGKNGQPAGKERVTPSPAALTAPARQAAPGRGGPTGARWAGNTDPGPRGPSGQRPPTHPPPGPSPAARTAAAAYRRLRTLRVTSARRHVTRALGGSRCDAGREAGSGRRHLGALRKRPRLRSRGRSAAHRGRKRGLPAHGAAVGPERPRP